MRRKYLILKAVLLLRRANRCQSKEEQLKEADMLTDEQLTDWIKNLKDTRPEWMKQGFESEEAYYDAEEADWEFESYDDSHYTPSATNNDYSPSQPWNAPGMSVRDFI